MKKLFPILSLLVISTTCFATVSKEGNASVSQETVNLIISGTTGLIAGVIGSLIAPWIHWGIEKRRRRLEQRLAMIQLWREILSNNNFDRENFINTPTYHIFRGFLTEETIKEIERPVNGYTIEARYAGAPHSPVNNPDRDLVLKEIARIEKDWKLI